ncbi:MAG TPA: DUF488 domain-containing protein [Dehalococcoidia bacterium]|nr:DUF488 domain-containing protein [Dehalococcoidia bacterium]
MCARSASAVVYTIGHSNQSLDRFLRLLALSRISALIDVRSQPYSQFAPQFNHAALAQRLEHAGIAYVFAGDTLGGRPGGHEYYDVHGHVLYYKVAQSEFFALGLSRLKLLVEQHERVAIMCSEEDPTDCHRRLLIGRVLAGDGYAIHHIRGDGRVQDEAEIAGAQKVSSLAQRGFFDDGEESLWRSSRSVLPARRPSSSSSH